MIKCGNGDWASENSDKEHYRYLRDNLQLIFSMSIPAKDKIRLIESISRIIYGWRKND